MGVFLFSSSFSPDFVFLTDDARFGKKDGMQLNKVEVLAVVLYVQLWPQRQVEHPFLYF